jgi:CubicO group peptidase (beta-lactamase class C family)
MAKVRELGPLTIPERCSVARTAVRVQGDVSPGWERVHDAFVANFADGNELGAAVAVYAEGVCVVDLWAGVADARTQRPWERDTVVPVFSTTKGATALCAHVLVQKGLLDLDAPVATYWPEFAAGGKAAVTVRQVMSHQAGLPYVDEDLTLDDLVAQTPIIEALARQAPLWEPGTAFAYHAVTYGHLVGEVVRRVSGDHLGDFFRSEVADVLGLQAWIGLSEDANVDLAYLERVLQPVPPALAVALGPTSAFARAITLGRALPLNLVDGRPGDFNDRRVLSAVLGGSSMVSDARSLARMYAACTSPVDGVRLLSEETVVAASEVQTRGLPYWGWPDELVSVRFLDFCTGFAFLEESGTGRIGHGGAGGSTAQAELGNGLGFGYVMNRMDAAAPDVRATRLLEAARYCAS